MLSLDPVQATKDSRTVLAPLKVSVILPTLNEAENIVPLIKAIYDNVPGLHEVIVVDDDSPDGTAELVQAYAKTQPDRRILAEKRLENHGLTQSLWHGITTSTGDVIVWMDCDFSMPPEIIPQLLTCIQEGYPIAVGSRFVRGGSFKKNTQGTQDSMVAVFLSRMMNYAVQLLLDHSFKDYTSGFAAVRKNVFNEIEFRGDYGEYFIDFIYRALRRGFSVIEIPYVCVPRKAGESKTGQNLWQYAKRGTGYLKAATRLRTQSWFSPKFPERSPNWTSETMQEDSPVEIQAMRREHVPLVAGLHHQVFRQTLNSRLGIPFLEALYGTLLEDSKAAGWVVLHDGHIIGFATATLDQAQTEKRLSRSVPTRDKLFALFKVLSSVADIKDLVGHKILSTYTRLRFGRPHAALLTLGVSPLASGKGVARALLEEAEAYFFCAHSPEYYASVALTNARARKFYERLNFRKVGQCINNAIYRHPVGDGRSIDEIHRSPFTIAPLSAAVIQQVAALHRQTLPQTLNSRLGIPYLERLYRSLLDDQNTHGWVALQGDRVIGLLTATSDLHKTEAWLMKQMRFSDKLRGGLRILTHPSDFSAYLSHFRMSRFCKKYGKPYPILLTLGVVPSAPSMTAYQLIQQAHAWYRQQGLSCYYLDTLSDNDRAQEFYKLIGFERLDEIAGNIIFRRPIA